MYQKYFPSQPQSQPYYRMPITAMAPAAPPRSEPYTMKMTLSCTDSSDIRTITMRSGDTVTIGRASKSNALRAQAHAENAIFDNPVVSRVHAQLMMNHWSQPGQQVSIIDKGSLHGTMVNGKRLERDDLHQLQNGDIIQLGDSVNRGESLHHGVSLRFDLVNPGPSIPSLPTAGIRAPYESESDSEALITPVPAAVSTKDAKAAMIGSQCSPIELDNAIVSNNVVDLCHEDDPEDLIFVSSKHTTKPATTTAKVISDSLDHEFSSVPGAARPLSTYSVPTEEADDDEDPEYGYHPTFIMYDNDSIIGNTSCDRAQDLNEIDELSEEEDDDGMDADYLGADSDGEDYHSEGLGQQSDIEVSDMSESEHDYELEEPANVQKEASPELGTETRFPLSSFHYGGAYHPPSFSSHPVDEMQPKEAPPKPRYDPVRGSQPPVQDLHFGPKYETYCPMPFVPAVFGVGQQPEQNTTAARPYRPYQHEALHPAPSNEDERTKTKLAISDLVEPKEAPQVSSEHGKVDKIANPPTNKRKADDMPDAEATDAPLSKIVKLSTGKAHVKRSAGRHRARSGTVGRVFAGAAKVAGGATLGAVGTIAFLSSSYAEQLIQWLA